MKYLLQGIIPVVHVLVFCAAAMHIALTSRIGPPLGGLILAGLLLGVGTLMVYDVLRVIKMTRVQLWQTFLWWIVIPLLALAGLSGFQFDSVGMFLVETAVYLVGLQPRLA